MSKQLGECSVSTIGKVMNSRSIWLEGEVVHLGKKLIALEVECAQLKAQLTKLQAVDSAARASRLAYNEGGDDDVNRANDELDQALEAAQVSKQPYVQPATVWATPLNVYAGGGIPSGEVWIGLTSPDATRMTTAMLSSAGFSRLIAIGDWVRVCNSAQLWVGHVGKVEAVRPQWSNTINSCRVELPDGFIWISANHLERWSPKAGEHVCIVKDCQNRASIGDVGICSISAPIVVRFHGENHQKFSLDELAPAPTKSIKVRDPATLSEREIEYIKNNSPTIDELGDVVQKLSTDTFDQSVRDGSKLLDLERRIEALETKVGK